MLIVAAVATELPEIAENMVEEAMLECSSLPGSHWTQSRERPVHPARDPRVHQDLAHQDVERDRRQHEAVHLPPEQIAHRVEQHRPDAVEDADSAVTAMTVPTCRPSMSRPMTHRNPIAMTPMLIMACLPRPVVAEPGGFQFLLFLAFGFHQRLDPREVATREQPRCSAAP